MPLERKVKEEAWRHVGKDADSTWWKIPHEFQYTLRWLKLPYSTKELSLNGLSTF